MDETKKPIIKKSLRWAENLENVAAEANASNLLMHTYGNSPCLAPLIEREIDDDDDLLIGSNRPFRKMRRSYSTSDMNKYLLSNRHEDTSQDQISIVANGIDNMNTGDSANGSTMIIPSIDISVDKQGNHLNETYDKTGPHLLNVNNVVGGISPSRVVNSSFMENSSILAGSTGSNPANFTFEKVSINFMIIYKSINLNKLTFFYPLVTSNNEHYITITT